jgi:hypothetical protein
MYAFEWTAVLLIWFTPIFGGQGVAPSKDFPTPLPIHGVVSFPDEKGCRKMIRELAAHKMRFTVIEPCHKRKTVSAP